MPCLLALIFLVALADYLFWDHALGISIAVFAGALFLVVTDADFRRKAFGRSAVVVALGALPVIEYVQLLSMAILALALLVALVWVRNPDGVLSAQLPASIALAIHFPRVWMALLRSLAGSKARYGSGPAAIKRQVRNWLRNWAFPLGGTLIFAALLIEANPVFELLMTPQIDYANLVHRVFFWVGLALVIWPFLDTELPEDIAVPPMPGDLAGLGINGGSVWRALWVFNALIGVQTALDLSILFGGASLPVGMTYAAYAHRGAYPLLATALLAGAFALAARPYLEENRSLRPLMLLWLAQNVVLCGSALVRIDLYIETYGLTYLRIYAQIWMGLVAAGLALAGWQVAARRSNMWLVLRCAGMSFLVLYCASFVNFAQVIADRNLTLAKPDYRYLCSLGPMSGLSDAEFNSMGSVRWAVCDMEPVTVEGWREWGFRKWRLSR